MTNVHETTMQLVVTAQPEAPRLPLGEMDQRPTRHWLTADNITSIKIIKNIHAGTFEKFHEFKIKETEM